MRGYLCYAGMELKRALKRLPHILAGAAVLVVLMGAAALLAGKLLYGGQAVERIPVGVVLPEEDALAGQAMRMVSSLESVKSLCDFTYIEEEATGEKLKKGELFAVLKMPDGFIQDIMSGVNTPVTVILPENAGAESRIFKELTDAGAEILGSAQAGIYSGDELLSEYGLTDKMAVFERDMNQIYLTYSLPRMDYFRKVMVNAAKDVSVPVFYGISAFVLVLLLSVISVSDLLKREPAVMRQKLSLMGIGPFTTAGSRILGVSVLLSVISVLAAAAAAWTGMIYIGLNTILTGFLVCQTAGSRIGGIFLQFFLVTAFHFLSGGFLPEVFLPESIQRAAPFLPTHILMEGVKMAVTGNESLVTAVELAALGVGGWLIAAAAEVKEA